MRRFQWRRERLAWLATRLIFGPGSNINTPTISGNCISRLLGTLQLRWLMSGATFVAIGIVMLAVILLYRKITSIGWMSKLLLAGVLITMGWIIIAGFTHFNAARAFSFPPGAFTLSHNFFLGLGSAMLIATYDYWGYYNVCFLGDEVKDPSKTIPRALLLSILLVGCLYVLMNISILGVVPWQEITYTGHSNRGLYVVSIFMQKIYGTWAANLVTALVMWTAFASVFSLLLGYSRVPYAAALDGNYFQAFARVHPQHRFPYVSLLALGGVAALFCFFSLADVIAALVVIRITLQFLVQAVGVIVLRIRRPDLPRPFRMWLYPLPALLASVGFIFVLVSRTNSLKQVRYALVILITGIVIYLVRAWRNREWPFELSPVIADGDSEFTEHVGSDQDPGACEPATAAGKFGMGSARRAPLPFALDRRGDLLHRYLDAERRRGLADDSAHDVAIDGQPGDGGDDLPVFLVILPAGALADMVDRRRFLLITQSWMVGAAGVLGVLTLYHHVTPWMLLLFTFILGLGAVMNDPAWQAITPEVVCPENHAPAVALNSVGFNVARAFGPALGGLVIAAAGSGVAFLLNAASFFGVIFFLYRWKRPHFEHVATGRVRDALLAGLRYVQGAPQVRSILIRTGAFSVAASSLPALLPILARPHGATGYGLLLGFFGLGALAGAAVLPRVRTRFSVDGVVAFDILLVRSHDLRRRTRPNIFPALSGIVCGRHRMDRNPGLPEHCRADHVSFVLARPRAIHVSAGLAGRHGAGQRDLGSVGDSGWRPGGSVVFSDSAGSGIAGGAPPSADVAAAGVNPVRG